MNTVYQISYSARLPYVTNTDIFAATHNHSVGDGNMVGPYALEMLALVVAVGGLVAVIAEIVMKDPAALTEIVTDVKAMAQPERRQPSARTVSNGNFRKAA
jgi:hypothetical protein